MFVYPPSWLSCKPPSWNLGRVISPTSFLLFLRLQINEEAEKAKDGVDAAGEPEEETKRKPLEPMQAEEEATA